MKKEKYYVPLGMKAEVPDWTRRWKSAKTL